MFGEIYKGKKEKETKTKLMMVNIYAKPRGRGSNFKSDLTETLISLHTNMLKHKPNLK